MNGLLDLNGKLHVCEPYGHIELAKAIVSGMGVSSANGLKAEEYLQKLGWVVVRTRDVYGLIGHYIGDGEERYHLTKAQKEWLNKAYEQMNDECRKSVDKMLEWDR